jgi:hypothetical protein
METNLKILRREKTPPRGFEQSVADSFQVGSGVRFTLRIRRTGFRGNRLIEICRSSYEQIRKLRAAVLVNSIQNSRSRFFLPENEILTSGTLEKVFKGYLLFIC